MFREWERMLRAEIKNCLTLIGVLGGNLLPFSGFNITLVHGSETVEFIYGQVENMFTCPKGRVGFSDNFMWKVKLFFGAS